MDSDLNSSPITPELAKKISESYLDRLVEEHSAQLYREIRKYARVGKRTCSLKISAGIGDLLALKFKEFKPTITHDGTYIHVEW